PGSIEAQLPAPSSNSVTVVLRVATLAELTAPAGGGGPAAPNRPRGTGFAGRGAGFGGRGGAAAGNTTAGNTSGAATGAGAGRGGRGGRGAATGGAENAANPDQSGAGSGFQETDLTGE